MTLAHASHNNGIQLAALHAAADAGRSPDWRDPSVTVQLRQRWSLGGRKNAPLLCLRLLGRSAFTHADL